MAEEGLHQDTVEFLEKRNAYRTSFVTPFQGEAAGEAAAAPVEGGADEDCGSGGCGELNSKFSNFPRGDEDVDQLETDGGWPSAAGLYEQVSGRLKDDTTQMEEVIVDQRQINVLESYRKQLLHKKQRRCHLLAALAESTSNDGDQQAELEEMMLNKLVGLEGNGGTGEEDTDNGEEE